MLTKLRGVLSRRPSKAGLFDVLLFVAVPYFLVGAVVAAFHLTFVRQLEATLASHSRCSSISSRWL